MGYMHIDNLYRLQDLLLFREAYAMEKIHGTSAGIDLKDGKLQFSSGEASHVNFCKLFDEPALLAGMQTMGTSVEVYGEAYGGKIMGWRKTYGDALRFIVFEVCIDGCWLSVPQAEDVAKKLGLEFVHYVKIPLVKVGPDGTIVTNLEAIDAERDADSVQAVRNGMGPGHPREGVVLRPLQEFTKNNGSRVVVKHKTAKMSECATPQKVVDGAKLEVLTEAKAIADQWVTPMRLTHVLSKLPAEMRVITAMKTIKDAMLEDVYREGKGELVESKDVEAAIGRKTLDLFRLRMRESLEAHE
jgi:hypothetical protein